MPKCKPDQACFAVLSASSSQSMASSSSGGFRQQWIAQDGEAPRKRRRIWRGALGTARPEGGSAGAQESERDLHKLLQEQFLSNAMSAASVRRFARAARSSGARGVDRIGHSTRHESNASRSLLRLWTQGTSKYPEPYWCEVPMWDDAESCNSIVEMPMILPHELVAYAIGQVGLPALLPKPGCYLGKVLHDWCTELQCSLEETVPLSLWGDGVPFSKKHSLNMVVMSFPAKAQSDRHLLFSMSSKNMLGKASLVPIYEVIAWSCRMMLLGCWPRHRHDSSVWKPSDETRRARAGQALGWRGGLVRIQGDWDWYHKFYDVPFWTSREMCWLCHATQDNYMDTDEAALWRTQQRLPDQRLDEIRASGVVPNPLFACPGITMRSLLPDWMHVVDLGVARDVLGNAFFDALPLLPGLSMKAKVRHLWLCLKKHYKACPPTTPLQNLTVGMIKRPGEAPTLRCKASECRGVVPFAADFVDELAGMHMDQHWALVSECIRSLKELSDLVSMEPWPLNRATHLVRSFVGSWAELRALAVEAGRDDKWRPKPKAHILVHLVEHVAPVHGAPASYWGYLDESLGGKVAKMALHRGGPACPATMASRTLRKHRAMAET